MKAIHVRGGGLDRVALADAPDPGQPGPGEVRVELHGSSVNFHDYLVMIGQIPTPDNRVPMTDGAGVVTATGAGVADFAVGDHVISNFFPDWQDGTPEQRLLGLIPGDTADGYAQEAIVAPQNWFTKAPRGYSYAEAGTLSCAGLTAWRALAVEGRVLPGQSVVVQGTGGVSLFALQIAKAAGARVIATSSSDEKLERMKALGADEVINYRRAVNWGEVAREMAGGDGADHVVEIGGAGTVAQSLRAVSNGGHVSMIGVLAGFAGEFPLAEVMMRQIRLVGITVGASRQLREFVRMIDATGLRPVLDRSFALEDITSAFRRQESGQHFGKIVVEW